MLEWLQTIFQTEEPAWDLVIVRLGVAALFGGVVAAVYAWTHRRDESFTLNFLATLVLLSILVATVTQVIGDNTARAFGLVGALAIVRFRTVVEDTRDTAFVMLAVIVGMSVGAGHLRAAIAAVALSAVAALLLQQPRPRGAAGDVWALVVRTAVGPDPGAIVKAAFAKNLQSVHLLSTGTARQGAAIELTWTVTLLPDCTPTGLVAELNRLEGVQNVEMKRA